MIAIAIVTPTRAAETLRQMDILTELASKWLGVFKLCALDGGVFFVPAEHVHPPPGPGDFAVLDPCFTTPEITRLARPQIGIVPGAVVWEACDEQNRFSVTTIRS